MQYRHAGTNAGAMAGEQATGGPSCATAGRAHPWPSGHYSPADQPVLHEVDQHTNQLLGVEARLSSIAKEDGMPDDIVAKTIPFDQLGIHDRVKEAGPRIIFTNASTARTSLSSWPCQ
jgi:hypothetical protein